MSVSRLLWLAAAAACLVGCASTDLTYRPFVGDAAVQQGAGGARDLADGVEIWVKGAPPKSYRVVGYLQSRHLDGADVTAMQRQIAQAVLAAGGDGAILTQSRRERGDGFVMGRTIVYDIEVTDELEVFRYE